MIPLNLDGRPERVFHVALLLLFAAFGLACRSAAPITLVLEQTTTVHLGEIVVLQIPSDRRYASLPGNTGGLTLVRRAGQSVWYRAARLGPDVIVVSPDVANGECISCATLHYFINVVPQK